MLQYRIGNDQELSFGKNDLICVFQSTYSLAIEPRITFTI